MRLRAILGVCHVLPDSVHSIYGFLSPAEMELLYTLAAAVPNGGVIIEIGSFQGKSTVCLGLGARTVGAQVWAVDPHNDLQVNDETHYGMENYIELLNNLLTYEVADVVRVVALTSFQAYIAWDEFKRIDLLWIDGSHEHQHIHDDLTYWSQCMAEDSRIAVHDASGHFPGVTQAVEQFLRNGEWIVAQQLDATLVLERHHV